VHLPPRWPRRQPCYRRPPPFKGPLPEGGGGVPSSPPPPRGGGCTRRIRSALRPCCRWRGPGRHLWPLAVCARIAPRDQGARRVALALRGPVPGWAATRGGGAPWRRRWPGQWPGRWPPRRWWAGPWPPGRRGARRTPGPARPAAAVARAASRSHPASPRPRGAPPRPWTHWAPTRRGPWTASTGQRSCRALASTWSACSARAPLAGCTWSTTAAGASSRPRCSTPTTAACGPTACARSPTCGNVCIRTSSPRTAPRSTAHLCTSSRRRWSTTSARLAAPRRQRSGAASLAGSRVAWPTSTGCP